VLHSSARRIQGCFWLVLLPSKNRAGVAGLDSANFAEQVMYPNGWAVKYNLKTGQGRPEMNLKKKKITPMDVLERLNSEKFNQWYNSGNFNSWVTGEFPKEDPRRITQEQILDDIIQMFFK